MSAEEMSHSKGRPSGPTQLSLPGIEAIPFSYGGTFAEPLDRGCIECYPYGYWRTSLPRIFVNTSGRTPLRVAWDTDVLIDYLEFGHAIWEGGSLRAPNGEPVYTAELRALSDIMQLWVFRDIRFYICPSQLEDVRLGELHERAADNRSRAIDELTVILEELEAEEEILEDQCGKCGRQPLGSTPSRELPPWAITLVSTALQGQGQSHRLDARRIMDAVRSRADVLLTRDGRLRKKGRTGVFTPLGLTIYSPAELFALLEEAGEGDPIHMAGVTAEMGPFLMNDFHKISHLIQALPPEPS